MRPTTAAACSARFSSGGSRSIRAAALLGAAALWLYRREGEDVPPWRRYTLGALLGQVTPGFFLGTILVLVVGLWLRWLPTSGNATWWHLILPAFAPRYENLERVGRELIPQLQRLR